MTPRFRDLYQHMWAAGMHLQPAAPPQPLLPTSGCDRGACASRAGPPVAPARPRMVEMSSQVISIALIPRPTSPHGRLRRCTRAERKEGWWGEGPQYQPLGAACATTFAAGVGGSRHKKIILAALRAEQAAGHSSRRSRSLACAPPSRRSPCPRPACPPGRPPFRHRLVAGTGAMVAPPALHRPPNCRLLIRPLLLQLPELPARACFATQ